MSTAAPPPRRARPGPWPQTPDPSPGGGAPVPAPPLSWAKRAGYKARFSGEATPGHSGQIPLPRPRVLDAPPDLEAGPNHTLPPPLPASLNGAPDLKNPPPPPPPPPAPVPAGQPARGLPARPDPLPPPPIVRRRDGSSEALPQVHEDDDDDARERQMHINYELRDNPGLLWIVYYGFQHYFSIMGSLILVPLVIVPAMGGTSDDTAKVVSTVLFVSGVSTLLHTSFGTRLPLIQGPSFIFLAPVLAIINSPEFQGLKGNLRKITS